MKINFFQKIFDVQISKIDFLLTLKFEKNLLSGELIDSRCLTKFS